ncbi:MAG: hypothetical protein AAB890_00460 [Patescibacteria group bacterium]
MRLVFLLLIFIISLSVSVYYFWNNFSTTLASSSRTNNNKIREYGVFCIGEERPDACYWFDNNGVLNQKATVVLGDVLLNINEISDYKPESNKQFLENNLWENMALIIEFLKSGKLDVKNVLFIRSSQDLIITTNDSVKILFSLRFNPQNNIAGLLSALEKNKMQNVSQIDLRVENKIFYK